MPKLPVSKPMRRGVRRKVKPNLRRTSPPPGPRPADTDLIEGLHPVLEALRSGRPMNRVVLSRVGRHSSTAEILNLAKRAGIVIDHVDVMAMDRLSPRGKHQGVVAIVAAKRYADLDELLDVAKQRSSEPLFVVLDGINDPQNLGAIIRTAEGAGGHGVIVPKRRAVGLTSTVAKSSSGALEFMPVSRVTNLARTLRELAEIGVWSVGVDPEGETDFRRADYTSPTAVVIGGEGKGLSRVVKEACDTVVSIPMKGRVASLNASVSTGVVLYEALKQREARMSLA